MNFIYSGLDLDTFYCHIIVHLNVDVLKVTCDTCTAFRYTRYISISVNGNT